MGASPARWAFTRVGAAVGSLTLAMHDPSPRVRRVAGEILSEIAAAEGSPRP